MNYDYSQQVVAIDIGGRPLWKGRNPPPIQYKIYGEVLLPGINYTDIVSIFEEHRICKKLGLISQHHFKEVVFTCNGFKVNGVCYRMEVLGCMAKKTRDLYFTVL